MYTPIQYTLEQKLDVLQSSRNYVVSQDIRQFEVHDPSSSTDVVVTKRVPIISKFDGNDFVEVTCAVERDYDAKIKVIDEEFNKLFRKIILKCVIANGL